MSERDKDFWDELFEFVKTGKVIPILGPELLSINVDGHLRPLYAEVADRLAARLKMSRSIDVPNPLDDVARRFIEGGGKRADIFKKIHLIMNEAAFEIPSALRQLASITDFGLYVSLSFDTLLPRAIDQQRYGGKPTVTHLAYALNKMDDLPAEIDRLTTPVVYSLLGRHTVGPDYVVTDEDTLEFVCSLQSESRRPQLLFDELARCNLLLLGCSFPDWLARFFIRTAKSRPLSSGRDEWEYWINTQFESNHSLVLFLDRFSKSTKRISCDPETFINEMVYEWTQRQQRGARPTDNGAIEPQPGDEGVGEAPAVFISYARQDLLAAESLCKTLSDNGIRVWFDKERLEGGDLYENKIRNNIEKCALFIPLMSRNTEQRPEGYFRREWRWADHRRQGIADTVPFIVPVVIDSTDPYLALAPDSFKALQWTKMTNGQARGEDVNRVRGLLREHVKWRSVH